MIFSAIGDHIRTPACIILLRMVPFGNQIGWTATLFSQEIYITHGILLNRSFCPSFLALKQCLWQNRKAENCNWFMICSFIHADGSQTFKITSKPGNTKSEGGSAAKDFWAYWGCVSSHKSPQNCSQPLLPPLVLWCLFGWRAHHGAETGSFETFTQHNENPICGSLVDEMRCISVSTSLFRKP